jgi:hypothetical protein
MHTGSMFPFLKMRFTWKPVLILAGFVAICGGPARAEAPHTPPVNSAERKAILDALRPPFEGELKQKVKFDVSFFKVLNGWAFVLGTPQNAQSGKPVRAHPDIDPDFCGLLHKNPQGEWTVVDHAAGFGDPFYASWPKDHKAPLAIFPEVVIDLQKNH